MNELLAAKIFHLGSKQRNPGLFDKLRELQASDFWTREQFLALQNEKLLNLFIWFKEHSAFYKALLPDVIDNPFEELQKLPIITKKELLDNIQQFQCFDKAGKGFLAETSGSTGDPFKFKKNLAWDTANRASFLRGYSWYNVDPWQRNGYFWGYSFSGLSRRKTALLDGLQNRFRVFSYDQNELSGFLDKMKQAVYIHGYSSMIFEVANIAKEMGYEPSDFPRLKMIKGTSEKIYPYYQDTVIKAFGHKIISEYGSAEGGIHAFECPHGNMHINEENVIVEEVNGDAIITNLNALSLPIIRYQIGDAIKLDSVSQCPCGRKSRLITEILGRTGKKIIGYQGSYPSLTLYYIFKNISLAKGVDIEYQGVQKELGKLTIKVTKKLSVQERRWIDEQSKDYFKGDVFVNIQEEQNIHDMKGKLKDFISYV